MPHGVALVVAPGGFGKTVALADFAHNAPFPVAWLSLSPVEHDLAAFVEALTSALRRVVPGVGVGAVRLAQRIAPGSAVTVAQEIVADLEGRGPIGLILDDFHAIDGARDVAALLGALLERAPSNLFVAVASRTLPALPHARLLAAGRLAGVPAEHLRFTADEVAILVGDARADQAAPLHRATGGWAAALLLAEMGSGAGFPNALEDYLESEVFAPQPPEVRDFLLRASVPPLLGIDLFDVLGVPDAPTYLARAARLGLFVSTLPDGGWRIHDLFRDFLRARLRRADPAAWVSLHLAVAAHMRAADRVEEAVTLLAGAELHAAAADLILDRADQLVGQGRWGSILHWLQTMPSVVLRGRPRLLTLLGRALMPRDPDAAIRWLDAAVDANLAVDDPTGAAEALVHRALRLNVSGRVDEAREDAARAARLLGDVDHPIAATLLRLRGLLAARLDRFDEAVPLVREALARAQRHRDRAETAMCERVLGWARSMAGDPAAASTHYERAARLWATLGDAGASAEVGVSLGFTYRELGSIQLARDAFGRALELAEKVGQTRVRAFALENLGHLDLVEGQTDRAIDRLTTALDLARQLEDVQLVSLCLDGLARCHRAADPSTAELLARQAVAEAERGRLAVQAAGAHATLGGVLLASGRPVEAHDHAGHAVRVLADRDSSPDLVRARLVQALAAHRLGASGWAEHLVEAARTLGQVRSTAFLAAEMAILGGDLSSIAEGSAGRAARTILKAAGAVPPPTQTTVARPRVGLPTITARLLGRPEVLVDGEPPRDPGRSWTRQPTRELFYLLEANRGGLSADVVVDRLWPGAPPGRGQSLLWNHTNRLRTALSGGDVKLGREILPSAGGVYRLNPDLPIQTDIAGFEAACAHAVARAGTADEDAALAAAAGAYGGMYLDGVDAAWLLARRRALARAHARILTRTAERALERGAPDEAVAAAERLMRAEPLAETACELLLRALVAAGARDRARRVYLGFSRRLRREMGTRPAPSLARLVDLPLSA